MKLQLTKPLCFFDLETTGTNISKDRIVEIAILKLHPDGSQEKNGETDQSRNSDTT
jgi:DNA polymerase-3 subunit epsilon